MAAGFWSQLAEHLGRAEQAEFDAPIALPISEEGDVVPVSPWHLSPTELDFTTREIEYLDPHSDLFFPGTNEDVDAREFLSGGWTDAISTWVVSYRWESYSGAEAPAAIPLLAPEAEFVPAPEAIPIEESGFWTPALEGIRVEAPEARLFPEAPEGQIVGATDGAMEIQYSSGAVCRYDSVSSDIALSFHHSLSKGRWIWANWYHSKPYTLIQEPHAGARKAAIHPTMNKRFLKKLEERGKGGEAKNRQITERFRVGENELADMVPGRQGLVELW
jgi:hypothetical protein